MRPVQTTHDPVCTVYTTGRGDHTAVRQQFVLQLDIHVVVLRNAATHTVPSSQLQPSTQANVSNIRQQYPKCSRHMLVMTMHDGVDWRKIMNASGYATT